MTVSKTVALPLGYTNLMTKYSNFKDYNIRKKYKIDYSNLFLLKSMLLNQNNDIKIRFKIMLKLDTIYRELFHSRIKNRCMYSTKIRSVYRFTNLTKSTLRDNLRSGNISGFRKASW